MKGRKVLIANPVTGAGDYRVIQVEHDGKAYYATPYALPMSGQRYFGPDDKIMVLATFEEIEVPTEMVRMIAAKVEVDRFEKSRLHPILLQNARWFRSPTFTEPPGGEDAPDIDDAAGLPAPPLALRGFAIE